MITVMPNVKDNSATPPSVQPQGRSQFFYSNGLAVQTTLYPSGGLQNYQNILNGIQLAQKDFNESGTLVSSQLDFWKVYTRNAGTGKNLFGGYARCERTSAMQDGVVQDSGAEYDPTSGLPIAQEKTYFDAAGSKKKLRSETLYAWQVPEYAAQFQNIHNYASVAMTKQLVLSDDGKTKNYVQAKATTYRNWAISEKVTLDNNYSTVSQIDSYETFDWITPGSIEPQFPAKKPVSSDWQLKTGIISRTNPKNLIVEQVDASGLIASFIYDKNQEFLVAKFPNGSLSGGEVSYYSFENYEAPQGWIIGSGATIIPNSNTLFLDAHTGFNSLRVDANTLGNNGITQTFIPARKEEKYIFSAWVKKPTGFNNTLGNARWNVTVNATTVSYIEFPETIGAWVYVSGIIPQSETLESLSIKICCENTNTASAILIDNLRFTPLACMMEAYSYNTKYQLPDSIIAVNGETSRTVYDNFQQAILTTNAADRTAKIDSSYFSRSGNQNIFTLTDPNHSLSAASEKDGSLTNFTRGSEWEKVWQPQADTWITEATILTQKTANLPGTLTYIGKTADDYTLDVEFNILETPTTPFGIQMGTRGSLQWNPQTALWQLLNANGVELLPAVDSKAFAISATPFSADLDNGIITPDLCQAFNRAGYLLSEKSTVSVGVTTSKGWTITSPDKRYRYVLKTDNNNIAVYAMNRRWILHVSKKNTVFWADGKMIFSFTGAENVVSSPTLFYGNRVAISNIATAMNAVLAVTFDDTRGETIQSQKYAESQMILAQNITDNIGRVAVRTKPAFITALQNPLFMFCANFAQMNWVTGTMTGLVNDAYPGDKGYPFSRVVFETSPLSRVLEESNPGELLRIGGGHTTRYRYNGTGIISGSLIYLQQTSTNANDIVVYEVRTLLDQLIKKVSVTGTEVRNETIFDDAGNPIELRSPNYFSPPANSKPSDWVTFQTFDFRNYLLSMEQGGKVLVKNIYDRLGNIRFSQDAQGGKSGTYKYTKYDILSRPIEAGYITGIWDEKKLQNTASSEAELPLNSPTWRTRNEYDGNQSTKYTIGRISQMQSNNANTGVEDVIEKLQYDVLGNTLVDNLLVKTFDAITEQIVTYQYNDLNTITSIVYPESNGKKLTVEYQINCLNQIVSVSSQQISNSTIQLPKTVLGTFSYDATGSPLQNMLHLDNQTGIKQSYGYNSPYWLTDINNQNASGTNLLNEAITYTEGGYQHAEYFDGTIASKDITIEASVKQETKYQFSYDPLGQILNAENPANSANNLGVKPPISYDANGNFTNLAVGDLGFKYNYFNGTQQINNVVNTANNAISAQYSYDENGNVLTSVTQDSAIGKSHNLAFTYDPFRSLAVEITGNNAALHLSYGCRNERLVKQINKISTPVTQKLYIRGTNSLPLMERTDNGDGSSTKKDVAYIYGPGGLIAMYREDAMYHVLKDHLGSITSVLDMQGSMVASYQYLTYGALATVNEPVLGFMPYLYTGQEYDFETDLYNYRARFYSAGLGRFLSVDPGRQYFSPYIYASNNPVLLIDPTGMFSIGSLFSAIAGVIIGVVEILIGVVIDVVAGLVAFFSGGLGTPATIALAALSGTFYGAGLSAITYSVFNFNDFSWKDYGIQTAIGFVVGGITAGLGAAATSATKVVATAVQTSLSEIAASSRLLAVGIEIFGQGGLAQTAGTTLLKGGAWLSEKGSSFSGTVAGWVTNGPVTAGWKGVATGLAKGVLKSEAIGISFNTGQNLAMGNNWDRGLAQTIFKSALSGSINGLQIRNRVEFG